MRSGTTTIITTATILKVSYRVFTRVNFQPIMSDKSDNFFTFTAN